MNEVDNMDKERRNDSLERLIARFMAGETTLAEEQNLYQIFARHEDLGPYERYRPMFAWYQAAAPAPRRSTRRIWLRCAASVIALIALGAAIYTGMQHTPAHNELYARLQGSYVRINGKNITDLNSIYNRLLSAEQTADSLENIFCPANDEINDNFVRTALDNITDPEIAALIKADLLGNDI